VWKALLLAGQVDVGAAWAVGALVGWLHAASALDPPAAATFATDGNFDALRITPYLRVTAQAHPDLRERLDEIAAVTAGTRLAVVHGDVSPKNILLGPDGPVLLDAECAWYVAFCVSHLLLKSVRVPSAAAALLAAARALAVAHASHVHWEPVNGLDGRVAALTPALALARVDGGSPVEYLTEPERAAVRSAARRLLLEPPPTVNDLTGAWAALTAA
jgi:hypothetical protein